MNNKFFMKLILPAITGSLLTLGCNVRKSSGAQSFLNANSPFQIEVLPQVEKYQRVQTMLRQGVAMIPRGDSGYEVMSKVYDQMPRYRPAVDAERVISGAATSCKSAEYPKKTQSNMVERSEAQQKCLKELQPLVLASVTGIELFAATTFEFGVALRDYMPRANIRRDIVLKPIELGGGVASPAVAKKQIEELLTTAVKKVVAAHVYFFPTIHFSSTTGDPACISQTLLISPFGKPVNARLPSEPSGKLSDDGKQHYGTGLFRLVQQASSLPQNYRHLVHQEFIAGYFDSALNAETKVIYAPVISEEFLKNNPEFIEDAVGEDHQLNCLKDGDCDVYRGPDVTSGSQCPIISLIES
jgi:hypothetical protein